MKRRYLAAIAVIAALVIAGCSSSGDDDTGGQPSQQAVKAGPLTVWLMDGSAPKDLVAKVNQELEAKYPGTKVTYQVQQWNGILDKLTAALASNTPPDVIELGNTQSSKFAASGGLFDLTDKGSELGSSGWLKGMQESGAWDGKQYAVPFYSANRYVTYRTDLFEKAGVQPPTSFAEWIQVNEKLMAANSGNKRFNALYLPGQNWYVLAQLIWDAGGELAVKNGDTWQGALDTPQAQAGIKAYQDLYESGSRAPADKDEATPQQFEVFAKGDVAQMINLPWEGGSLKAAAPKLADKLATFPIPSVNAGQTAPVFLGGSDLAIPAASKNTGLAYEWLKLMLAEKTQTELAKTNGAVPATAQIGTTVLGNDPLLGSMVKASANGKITPNDPTWAAVEAGDNPLKSMMTQILTGKADIAKAASDASKQIADKMAAAQ